MANVGLGRLLSGFTKILAGAADYLAPGGYVVITARPWRQHAELVPLPAHLYTCGELAGLVPVERCVALLGRLTEGELVARSSFFQRDFIVKQRAAGLPMHLIAHEDVIILRKPEATEATERRRAAGRFPFGSAATLPSADSTGSGSVAA
ncbi:hypothetical protein [Nocardia farcinica]|uniref:hypothetical protein n=1 Tax=Nocardia farcinica TaxID=37329 RepID=UPI00189591AA|nr:hypothetical protein [Nocardia farcinica]MBF6270992.1 hypothetical protein [Nocardia farcinica]